MHIVSCFVIRVRVSVTPFVTAVYTAFIFKLLFFPVSIVSVAISLKNVAVVVIIIIIIPSSIVSSRFTVLFETGK